MKLLQDRRLKQVRWRDLARLSIAGKIIENTITLPWLASSLVLAYHGYYLLALPLSFIFFLTGLRQAHNGFHRTLGTSAISTWMTLVLNSVLMLAAMHAIKYNHLRHHRYCLQEGDVEGRCARMSAWAAVCYGPVFIYRQHATALRYGSQSIRQSVRLELAMIFLFLLAAGLSHVPWLVYHAIAMTVGEMFTAFFAVWTVHHDCDEEVFARTLKPGWKNWLTYNMFYHLEHHLFPGVPTVNLPKLSRRIREELPDLRVKEVF